VGTAVLQSAVLTSAFSPIISCVPTYPSTHVPKYPRTHYPRTQPVLSLAVAMFCLIDISVSEIGELRCEVGTMSTTVLLFVGCGPPSIYRLEGSHPSSFHSFHLSVGRMSLPIIGWKDVPSINQFPIIPFIGWKDVPSIYRFPIIPFIGFR
jgi:hypothetical protein